MATLDRQNIIRVDKPESFEHRCTCSLIDLINDMNRSLGPSADKAIRFALAFERRDFVRDWAFILGGRRIGGSASCARK